jgi:GNAT superfamily N-acetyltransferase
MNHAAGAVDPIQPASSDRGDGRSFSIRAARPEDVETLVSLVRELAVYEKLEQRVSATSADFLRHLFGGTPAAEAVIALEGGEAVGFALWFTTFSTFRGQPGLYLEDIFVKPAHRGRGIGKALLATIARQAIERGYGRVEWSVLNWNTPAIGFYRSLGARPMDAWTVYRIDDEALQRLATVAPVSSLSGSDGRVPAQ